MQCAWRNESAGAMQCVWRIVSTGVGNARGGMKARAGTSW